MEGEVEEIPGGLEGEIRGLNNIVRNAKINSNGHGGRRESIELDEIVKSLQK